MKKLSLVVFLSLLLSFQLIAAGSSDRNDSAIIEDDGTTKLNLVLMTKDSNLKGFNDYIAKVEEACNLDITVIATPTNANDRQARVATVLSTNDNSVDIITVNDEMYTAFKNTGWLENLNNVMTKELIQEYPVEYMNDMVITNGNVFSVPIYFSAYGWFINKSIMEETGISSISTYSDFLSFVKKATNSNRFGYGDAWDPNYVFNSLGSFVNLFGGNYYDWTDPKTQAGLHALINLVREGYTSTAQLADQFEQTYQNMASGNIATALLYTGQIANFSKAGLYTPEGPIEMITPPVADDEVGSVAYCSSWHYVLNSASTNTTAAKRFLKYVASEEGQLNYTLSFGTYPAYLSLLESDKLDNIAGIDQMREYVDKVTLRGRPIVAESMEYISEIGNLFHRLVLNQIDEAEFCKQAQISTNKFV